MLLLQIQYTYICNEYLLLLHCHPKMCSHRKAANTATSKLLLEKMVALFSDVVKSSFTVLFLSSQSVLIMHRVELQYHFLAALCCLIFAAAVVRSCFIPSSSSQLYLVDFACLKPPDSCKVPLSKFIKHAQNLWEKESADFMTGKLTHSGQGEETYLPPGLHFIPPKADHKETMEEVHMALFPVLAELLSNTKTAAQDIDVLIVNCSGFCPSPSLSSILVNRFSMREDVKSYTISGMGCSASILAIDMAHDILKTHGNSNAVILSTEILTTGWYPGKEKPKLVLNCLFRMGAAAILVSNKKQAKETAKYKLIHSLRTQRAFDDTGYLSAIREEDSHGITGVTLRKDLLQVAGETLRTHITILGSKILPHTEIFLYVASIVKKLYWDKSTETYVPNFKKVMKHFCLPASGKAVIREIGKGLRLGEKELEPALMTLHRFGNQSSSSSWYQLAYMEAKQWILKGDRVLQLGMGTGPKSTSLVWESIRPIHDEARKSVWADCIDRYPHK